MWVFCNALALHGRLQKDGEMTVRVDGPYGESGEMPAWLKHPVLMIFAGGIGVRLFRVSIFRL